MPDSLLSKIRDVIESIAPSREILAQRNALAAQEACCALLMEIARLDAASTEPKLEAVRQAMRDQFGVAEADLAPMLANASTRENRLTSYYRPVALLNQRFVPEQKVRFIEQLWRVAIADGMIDMYEDHLVRKLADLLYVSHTDFILAKHRVQVSQAPAK
jgi:uncharacterized tellurite resistance protein B-like protein